uniref:2-octaprenyl-6-methoxyphenol hydroxylase (EC) n=1 Tax=uncultured Thiotrichaceae bacterium TaxID=298394 RepID=A0A6S6UDX4_9GAMM|nr:MAG: 2-octaprenyl-6-methoxyphenol hydroxylase (EC [uncultured Thiotrichaceae bacterium]
MFDVLIVGGGMVGASMAVALRPLGLKVGLVEAFAFAKSRSQQGYDDRSVALSHGSSLIFKGMGLWETLRPQVEAIQNIHVSDRGYFGATRLSAEQQGVPALGYVVESRVLGGALYDALADSDIEVIAPAKVMELDQSAEVAEGVAKLTVDRDGEFSVISGRLLIVADGSASGLRDQLGIGVNERDYEQSAVIANVTTSQPHNNVAFERFTASGPLALLPMTEGRYSLVWTHRSDEVASTMALDDAGFLAKLQQAFGYRQGDFIKVGERTAYPLKLIKSTQEVSGRAVIIGNTSHTLHPVAGQGLNLALRDIAVLTDLVAEAVQNQSDLGDAALLKRYEAERKPDYDSVVNYTDGLVWVFSKDFAPLGHARAGGLLAVDRIAPLRGLLAKQSMGLRFRQSRLSRGLALKPVVSPS